jgi:hypothetical protein
MYRQDPRCKEWEELMDAGFHGGWQSMASDSTQVSPVVK